jgi:hypothetical protein
VNSSFTDSLVGRDGMNKIKIVLIMMFPITYVLSIKVNMFISRSELSIGGVLTSLLFMIVLMGVYYCFGYSNNKLFRIGQIIVILVFYLLHLFTLIYANTDNYIPMLFLVVLAAPFSGVVYLISSYDVYSIVYDITLLVATLLYFLSCNLLYFWGNKKSEKIKKML